MKHKKSARAAKQARIIVSLSPVSQASVGYYTSHCGYTSARAVAELIQIGDAAFRKNASVVDARRALILADGKLAELNRGHSKRVSKVKRQKRALRASAAPSSVTPDAQK